MEFLTHICGYVSTKYATTCRVLRRDRKNGIAKLMPAIGAMLLSLTLLPFRSEVHAQIEGSHLEYRVKAAFLLNFAKFVSWPPKTFTNSDAQINICIVGQDPFGLILDQTITGEYVDKREIRAHRLSSIGDFRGCNILFISRAEREHSRQLLSRLSQTNVLTVAEFSGFAESGGMVEFLIDAGKVRFYINAAAAEAAGLRFSSQLLRVAKEVKSSRG
jgi:hypothetical protein